MLQYITNTSSAMPVVEQVNAVIAGGGRWIQVRMKDASDEEIRKVVEEIMPLCLETESFLLLNDRVELAKTLNVGGVHIGKNDMAPSKARMELGPAAVIGVTVNTIDDILALRGLDIDYVGMGPFRYTDTKKNLSPILGIEGIKLLCDKMEEAEIENPRVAVGGICYDDLEALIRAGVNGVAVSGAIANSKDPAKETERMVKLLSELEKEFSSTRK